MLFELQRCYREIARLEGVELAAREGLEAAEWMRAMMDRGDGVLEYTGTFAERDEALSKLGRLRAALTPREGPLSL